MHLSHASYTIWNPSKCQAAYLRGGGLGVPRYRFIYKKKQKPAGSNDLVISTKSHLQDNMSLSDKDKASVKAFWSKIGSKADDIGADALTR